ncbi:LysR substrate-binding domain-containing protein [Zoogloea sp.]|uniref:LysR substrate-binding domain-containing protein n=1 Tax=Zoogloea sp. TaxID=49181 RepID=UPI001AC634D4|nr:LysR substrate-binding domain-containing protein [Zoogloea sp.]MBN8283013.1 LysR family transcriptional regulator [Zoogloea sp.]
MDLSDLRMFRTIIEAGSLTRAAEQLHTVQSNVTTRLRQLEEDLGTPLFDRINRRLVITPAGTLLAGYAEKLLSLAEEARDAVRRADQPEGLLRLGAMETTAAARLPGVIAAFRRAYPRVELRLRTAPTPTLVQEVLTHQLDAALVSGPLVHPELECRAVVLEELVLISAADWAPIEKASDLARHGPVELFTFREGCSYRQRLFEWLQREGIPIARSSEFGTFEAILGCVAAGMGISLVPRAVIGPHLGDTDPSRATLRVHPAPPDLARSVTVMIWHRARTHQPARQAFAECLAERLGAVVE